MLITRLIGFFVILSAFYQIGFVSVNAAEGISNRNSQLVVAQVVSFDNSTLQQDFYLNQSKVASAKVDEARRVEAERKAKEEADRIAQELAANQIKLAQITAKKKIVTSVGQINGDFESAIRTRCAAVGCNPEQLIRIMYCESGGRSNAQNPSGASGLFQFMPRTFSANAARIGLTNADIWNPYHQIDVATTMFANGQAWQWVCK